MQGLSRILVPINYTREPRFRHDPAYTVPPLPTLAVAAELPGMSPEIATLRRGRADAWGEPVCGCDPRGNRLVEGALA